ncbi:hypothetical protein ABIE50_001827 [Chitinophaga sp. OAE865]
MKTNFKFLSAILWLCIECTTLFGQPASSPQANIPENTPSNPMTVSYPGLKDYTGLTR